MIEDIVKSKDEDNSSIKEKNDDEAIYFSDKVKKDQDKNNIITEQTVSNLIIMN